MYKLRVGQRVTVRANGEWTYVQAEYVGRTGTVVGYTAGAFHLSNECYDVLLDGEGTRVFCFCFNDLR
jgi:ribosomal protein L21E